MPKKIWYFFGGALILTGFYFWLFGFEKKEIRNFPSTKTGPILIFGDSLAEGVGSTREHDLSAIVEDATGIPTLNYGVSGNTTEDALTRIEQAADEDPRLVIIILGGNDFLKKIPRDQTFDHLENVVNAFQNRGAITILVGVRSGILGGGANEDFEKLAQKTKSAYLEDILQDVFGNPQLMSDALHPNDHGYATIGKRLIPLVRDLLK